MDLQEYINAHGRETNSRQKFSVIQSVNHHGRKHKTKEKYICNNH